MPCPSGFRRGGVGDDGVIQPEHRRAQWRAAPSGSPRERKDALDTAVASRRRCRAQVASVAAAASAASLGVKPQAEAPHSAPDAPRGALRRRLRRRTTSSARARTQRHRLVAARARAGPTWESERSSSVTSRRAAKAARAQVEGKWRGNWEPLRHPTRLEPAAAGRRRAARRSIKKKR